MILVSCLHLKDVITKSYPNYSKSDKVEGLVAPSEGPNKLICHEEKVVVVFHHPQKTNKQKNLILGLFCQFVHVTEEGDKLALFDGPAGGGANVEEAIEVVAIVTNNMSESTETEDSDNNIPMKIAEILESCMALELLQSTMRMQG